MTLSSIFFLDLQGKVLLSRHYRGDIGEDSAENFIEILGKIEADQDVVTPILTINGLSYIHIRHSNIYLLAITKRNSNVMSILLLLEKIVKAFTEHFNVLNEESLRDNFVIVYELLDEMVDFGHPQSTDVKQLSQYITQTGFKFDMSRVGGAGKHQRAASSISKSNIPWRPEGIKYRKNEVFLDVIEKMNLLVNSNGVVVQSEIEGTVRVRCFLSGMPELRLGLNDKILFESTGRLEKSSSKTVELEDTKFHQCVNLEKFDGERTITFIPPDGEFDLMSYRITPPNMKAPIWVETVIERWSTSRIEFLLTASNQLTKRTNANSVEITVPVPPDADSPRFKSKVGVVAYAPEKNAFIWTIGFFPSGKEFSLSAQFGFPSVKSDSFVESSKDLPPVSINFEVPYHSSSGIQVRYLKIEEKSKYPALPWVRYITQNGTYLFRQSEPLS